MSDYIGPEGGAPEAEVAVPTPAGAGGELARITAGVRRVVTVPVSGPAPANGAAFVTFANQGIGTWISNDIAVGSFDELAIDFDVTAIVATGTAQLLIDRKDAAGIYRNIVTAVAKTGVATDIASIGPGFPLSGALGAAAAVMSWSVPVAFGDIIRVRVVVATAIFTSGTLSIKGK